MQSNIIQKDPLPKVKWVPARICKEKQHKQLARIVAGCSLHMISRKYFLHNLKHMYPSTIGLPNVAEMVALQKGMPL